MNPLDALADLRNWPRSQQLLRLVLLLGPVLALVLAGAAGNGPALWVVAAVLALSLLWAASPESSAGVFALVLVLFWWTRVPDDALHPAALLAAVAVAGCHVAAVVVGAAPPRTPVDAAVLRLWAGRASAVLLAAPVLWVLARALRDDAAPAGLWPAALVALLLVVVGLTVGLGRREAA